MIGGKFTTKVIEFLEPQSMPLNCPAKASALSAAPFLSLQSFSLIKLMAEFSLSEPASISYPAKPMLNSTFGLLKIAPLIEASSSFVFSIFVEGGSEVITIKAPLSSEGTRPFGTF